jgi:hypothetical protein
MCTLIRYIWEKGESSFFYREIDMYALTGKADNDHIGSFFLLIWMP